MNKLIFLFFRRMRAPLLVLISAYALSIGGLVLIPGLDDQGNPWRFDFFHAFYFVSFMGSTIGFGEIPYPFSVAQRMWTTLSLYICVISWIYAIGSILTIVQAPGFRLIVTEQLFTRQVKHLTDPFYVVCGYGETGSLLVSALHRRDIQTVVLDIDTARINQLNLENFDFDIPALCADAREVHHLLEAGLQHRCCIGVIALTDDEDANVKIAISSKLLRPALTVVARAESRSTAANLASFNTDHVVDPFSIFADHLAMALRVPSVHLLYKWLISTAGVPLPEPIQPPRGTWVVCGFGRFGRAVHRYMEYEGVSTTIIESNPEHAPEDAIVGRGTEGVTLREAGIDKAVGVIAGTDQDINNLSIVMTAKALNPKLYVIARQNRRANDPVFKAAQLDMVMQSSRIIVWHLLPLLTSPLLRHFLRIARHHNQAWAQALLERIETCCGEITPHTWSVQLDEQQAPAVTGALRGGRSFTLATLLREPQQPDQALPIVPLLLLRGEEEILLPEFEQFLQCDDQLLLCAPSAVAGRLEWVLCNSNVLDYVETGELQPTGYLWRWLTTRRHQARNRGNQTSSASQPSATQ